MTENLPANDEGKTKQTNTPLNLILYGPPGTGKTYEAIQRANDIIKDNPPPDSSNERIRYIRMVTFHPSFGYEEFIEGIRPTTHEGQISYKINPGIFKSFCAVAKDHPESHFVFIIDEINRGDIARIFGECITLLEEDKRDTLSLVLPYSHEAFTIPKNVYIIGTMNAIDRTARSMDFALRRRFAFQYIGPDANCLSRTHVFYSNRKTAQKIFFIRKLNLGNLLKNLNKKIADKKGRDYRIGHAYFLAAKNNRGISLYTLTHIFLEQIIPLLEEYFYHSPEDVKEILDDKVKKLLGDRKSLRDVLIKHLQNADDDKTPNKLFEIFQEMATNNQQENQN